MQPTLGYWWKGKKNFGDLLSPLLFDHFSDVEVIWAPVDQAKIVGVGSILEHLPNDWYGTVVGSGKLHGDSVVHLPKANIMALRGPLTALGFAGSFALGDPGLLANDLVVDVDKEYNLGIVPHWSDKTLVHRHEFKFFKPHVILPSGDPLEVIREIGKCKKIVSSSLHGIVVADSFGIPRRTEMTPQFEREGGDFKFRDYNASVNVEFKIGVTQEAPRYQVEKRQQELFDVFINVGRQVMGISR